MFSASRSKTLSLVRMFTVMSGALARKEGRRGISQRVPSVGRTAMLSTPTVPWFANSCRVAASMRSSAARIAGR